MSAPNVTVPNTNSAGLGVVRQPKLLYFGPGVRRSLPSVVASVGTSALIVTDARMAQSAEFAGIVEGLTAAGISVSTFSDVQAELPRTDIDTLVADVGGTRFDAVIGIGGGSCLDMAKVASLMLAHGGNVRDYYGEHKVPGPTIPIITVPTTAGTGAEVTCISVIYEPDLEVKVGIASPYLEAYAAVVDPELTLSAPPGLTAATGADALSHLVEAFTAIAKNPSPAEVNDRVYVGKNVLTDVYCRAGFELINRSLEKAYTEPSDLQARSDTMRAALNAGLAINTTGTAAAHAIQTPIGALTHTAHGVGVGALLPYVMRFNLPERVAEFAELGRVLGVADAAAPDIEQARAGITRVEEILDAIGIPRSLAELGLEESSIEKVAEQAMLATRLTANNPRTLTVDSVVDLLRHAYSGDRTWWS